MKQQQLPIAIEKAPHRLDVEYATIFTKEAKQFLYDFITEFEPKVERILLARERRRLDIAEGKWTPAFKHVPGDWRIREIPQRIRNRQLDLGDVSPANTANFIDALYANVRGVQVDFDDGFCTSWRNIVLGLYNITAAVHSLLPKAPVNIEKAPILWLRPRAFNMIEHHCMVNGKEVSGPLFDFALLMFHNAGRLSKLKIGPYFYLSKIEDSCESALWNEIFEYTQRRLDIPLYTIKSIVLIENILAAYCMEEILYSIRNHVIGLNCGIWDYSASIIAKFGNNKNYIIPDRNKYVNVTKRFLATYMRLVIATSHARGALATGGMAAQILSPGKGNDSKSLITIDNVRTAKKREIEMGVDGFMVYDLRLVPHMNEMWRELCGQNDNQLNRVPNVDDIDPMTLLDFPEGGVTIEGLKHNIAVALLFIYHWLSGSGVFYYKGAVEDSATAEISRSQLWQWIRFSAAVEDSGPERLTVSRQLVYTLMDDIIVDLRKSLGATRNDAKRLLSAKFILLEIITSKAYIEYFTTFLNDNHKFRALHNKNDGLESKL